MRGKLLGVVIAAVIALGAVPATAAALPGVLTPGAATMFTVRPAVINYTLDATGQLGGFDGNGTTSYGHLTWTSWTATSAAGHGAVWIDNCNPNCGQGTFTPLAVRVAAFAPVGNHFTRLQLRYRQSTDEVTDTPGVRLDSGIYQYYQVSSQIKKIPGPEKCEPLASAEPKGFGKALGEPYPLPSLSSDTVSVGIAASISLGEVSVCQNAIKHLAAKIATDGLTLNAAYAATSALFKFAFLPLGWQIPPGTGAPDRHPPVTIDWFGGPELGNGAPSFGLKPGSPPEVSFSLVEFPVVKADATLISLGAPLLSAGLTAALSVSLKFDPKELATEKATDEAEGATEAEANADIAAEIQDETNSGVQAVADTVDPAASLNPAASTVADNVSTQVGDAAVTTLAEDTGAVMAPIDAAVTDSRLASAWPTPRRWTPAPP